MLAMITPIASPPTPPDWGVCRSNHELARRFAQLETRLDKDLTEHDRAIGAILLAIRELMHPRVPVPKRRPIGFTADLEEKLQHSRSYHPSHPMPN
jgi:hypothetical protein